MKPPSPPPLGPGSRHRPGPGRRWPHDPRHPRRRGRTRGRRQLHHHPGRRAPHRLRRDVQQPRQFATANAPAGAVPTNDWWSSLLFKRTDCAFSEPLHAHPTSYDTFTDGLGFSANSTPAISGTANGVGEYHYPYVQDIRVGVAGLAAPQVKVDGWTDWTVSPYWSDGARTLRATIGHGLPFAYFQASGGDAVIGTSGTADVWSTGGATIGFRVNGHDYVAYAPSGATWTVSGGRISSTLAGRGYFSVALLPRRPAPPNAPTWPPPTVGTRTPTSPAPGSPTPTTRPPTA